MSHENRVSLILYSRYKIKAFDYIVGERDDSVRMIEASDELFEDLKAKDDQVRGKKPMRPRTVASKGKPTPLDEYSRPVSTGISKEHGGLESKKPTANRGKEEVSGVQSFSHVGGLGDRKSSNKASVQPSAPENVVKWDPMKELRFMNQVPEEPATESKEADHE